jgi:putative acetyltransferase
MAQGQGIGHRLFVTLLDLVTREHPDITRVELITQETNHRALRLYEGLGFRREGRLAGRIRQPDGTLDADIPLAWLR